IDESGACRLRDSPDREGADRLPPQGDAARDKAMPIVEVHELTKNFPTTEGGEKVAVDGVSFSVEPGQIYGLLGPNGAGKTTTLRMLSGLLTPTSGYARLSGYDVKLQREEAKRCLGYLTASTGLY